MSNLLVYMTPELKEQLREVAQYEKRSMTGMIIYVLESYIKEHYEVQADTDEK